MSSSDNDTEIETPHIKYESIEKMIAQLYPNYLIIEHSDDYYFLQKEGETILVYEKKIKEDIGVYLDKISNFLFAPVAIHKEDYYKIQKKLSDLQVKKCAVIITTTYNNGSIEFIAEVIHDPFYMKFIKNNNLMSKKCF